MARSGFYQGEKKKPKKGKDGKMIQQSFDAPTFVAPAVIKKDKKSE